MFQNPVRAISDASTELTSRVALAGNPNAGKTSLFNALTGSHQHVGNYAGVTVEKRTGELMLEGRRIEVHDLPGTYSLAAYSPEERIAEEALLGGGVDVRVAVVDATALRRSMGMVAQLMQMPGALILALNMSDEASSAGQKLDLKQLEQLLGFPVVETVGHRGGGIQELEQAILRQLKCPSPARPVSLGERLEAALSALQSGVFEILPSERSPRWTATRLLQGDAALEARIGASQAGRALLSARDQYRSHLEAEAGMDIRLLVTTRTAAFTDQLLSSVLLRPMRPDARASSDKIDRILAHRIFGLPFFFFIMYLVFYVTFTVGAPLMDGLDAGFVWLSGSLGSLWPQETAPMLRSLVLEGVIGGVGGVLVFLPNILLLFLCLTLLEDTGYMARAAFLMDRLMHRFGLHGRSFIPLMTGFGCSIPGIMATRTLENERDRLTTMLVLPLMSCGARLPIWLLLIPAFFPPALRTPMLWGIYMVGIVLALGLAWMVRRTLLKGEEAPFVMEVPPYRLPTLRSVLTRVLERAWTYVRKAGTLILAISILMWTLLSFPRPDRFVIDREVEAGRVVVSEEGGDGSGKEVISTRQLESRRSAEQMVGSAAGQLGRALEPLVAPIGFDWRIATAMIGAFAAKEVFVAQLGVLYAVGDSSPESERLQESLRRDYSIPTALSLMLFLLIATPCMATFAVVKRESGSWKWPMYQFVALTGLAYLLSLGVYQGAKFLM